MENILECNICLEKYDNKEKIPRILKCGHTFCTKCLKELTKANNNLEIRLPYVKCPLDKTIGHSDTHIEEIPINRIIVDILDLNGFGLEKLSLKEEKKSENLNYITSAADRLKKMSKFYETNFNNLRDRILSFLTVKNNCIAEISEHFDKMMSILDSQKLAYIYQIEKYSKEKIDNLNEALHSIEMVKGNIQIKLERIQSIKNQNYGNLSLSDELAIVNSLSLEDCENKDFEDEVNKLAKENPNDVLPKVLIRPESNTL
jgi:hypothetical protein